MNIFEFTIHNPLIQVFLGLVVGGILHCLLDYYFDRKLRLLNIRKHECPHDTSDDFKFEDAGE